jgi:sirohydrochlorin cobaltochelatase
MSGTALVIAAHGSHVEPAVNARVHAMAERLAGLGGFDEVVPAFHQGFPRFAEVLDCLRADEVLVVPLMSSEGFYSRVVLPRELARNRRYLGVRLGITLPVGTHPQIVELVAGRVWHLLSEHQLDRAATTLAVIGHGTDRHAESGRSTVALAEGIERLGVCEEVLHAFLDEDPLIETILDRAAVPNVVVIPFLIAPGPHAVHDIPARIRASGVLRDRGASNSSTPSLPVAVLIGGRHLVIDEPVGMDPGIVDLVADLARSAFDADVKLSA